MASHLSSPTRLPLVRTLALLLALAGFGASAFLLANVLTTGVFAHSTLDQTLIGDPACNATNFRGTVSSSGSIRQEFVPSQSSLLAVDLCLSTGAGETVDLNIRSGTADAPGPVLASASTVTGSSGSHYVHLDLAAPLSTTPGAMLVIDIPDSFTFAWRGTCAEVLGACTSIDPDIYPQGQASFHVGDFAFRTYGDGATPAPTPTGTPPAGESVAWGDNNCSLQVDPVDSLFVLRGDAGLPTNTGDCPEMGQVVDVAFASPHPWGDVDCKDGMTPVDSLKLLRFDAGLSVSQAPNCPLLGSQVIVTE